MRMRLGICAVVMAFSMPVAAADQAVEVVRIEGYLSSITTITADFNQTNPDGTVSTGKFYLKRPGKMRWEYAPPTPILLVSDGKTVTYYDAELEQVSYVSADDTLAGFLAQPSVKLDSPGTRMTRFDSAANALRVTLIQKKKPNEGSLTLEFSDKPLTLRQMTIVDATGQVTQVQLQNAKFGGEIDAKKFQFTDPRGLAPQRHRK